jgi:hypothetical protein
MTTCLCHASIPPRHVPQRTLYVTKQSRNARSALACASRLREDSAAIGHGEAERICTLLPVRLVAKEDTHRTLKALYLSRQSPRDSRFEH